MREFGSICNNAQNEYPQQEEDGLLGQNWRTTMPIQGLEQPEIIAIEPTLRLRKFDGRYDFALKWYQDEDVV